VPKPNIAVVRQSAKCLRPDCDRSEKHRGLCSPCYQAASELVRCNVVTWEALVTAGKALFMNKASRKGAPQKWLLEGTERKGASEC